MIEGVYDPDGNRSSLLRSKGKIVATVSSGLRTYSTIHAGHGPDLSFSSASSASLLDVEMEEPEQPAQY
jgi:hypothetical protein